MTANNLLAWNLQIAVLVVLAAVAAQILRLRLPGARLLYWQATLLACLALPIVRPWKPVLITAMDSASVSTITHVLSTSAYSGMQIRQLVLLLLTTGILARVIWLATGLWRLRRYRRHSRPMASRDGASLRLSDTVSGPVTFGTFRPIILLPAHFPELAPYVQEAIIQHELLHVRRRDWLSTLGEEVVRTVFWFHPAIWWLLAEIGLAREQEVDRQVVASTKSPEQYVDALLAIARGRLEPDLAPASLFLRKRHLKQRIVLILTEVRMSRKRLISSLAAALGILVAACWLATDTFPLVAAPQVVVDSVAGSDGPVMHVFTPENARVSSQQNTVVVQAKVLPAGNVVDAQVVTGPDQLRKAALQTVLNSHRPPGNTDRTEQITVVFDPDAGVLSRIDIKGVSDPQRAELAARLPIHVGERLGAAQIGQVAQTVSAFDSRLTIIYAGPAAEGAAALIIGPLVPRIAVGGNVQAAKIRFKSPPVYPIEAKQAHIQGVVELHALIGKDGMMENLSVISGHPLLAPSALEAVRHWVYEPTLVDGNPVQVDTQIDVNYTLTH